MPVITETRRAGGFLVWEAHPDYTRQTVTIDTGALAAGMVLGRITATGKFVAWNPSASDGSQTAAGVLWDAVDATAADAPGVAVVRGPAIVAAAELLYAGAPTEAQIAAAHEALGALGILVR